MEIEKYMVIGEIKPRKCGYKISLLDAPARLISEVYLKKDTIENGGKIPSDLGGLGLTLESRKVDKDKYMFSGREIVIEKLTKTEIRDWAYGPSEPIPIDRTVYECDFISSCGLNGRAKKSKPTPFYNLKLGLSENQYEELKKNDDMLVFTPKIFLDNI